MKIGKSRLMEPIFQFLTAIYYRQRLYHDGFLNAIFFIADGALLIAFFSKNGYEKMETGADEETSPDRI